MVAQLPVLTGHSIQGSLLTAFIALISGVGFLLFGYDQGVMSGLVTEPEFALQFPKIATYTNLQSQMPVPDPYNVGSTSATEVAAIQGVVVGIYEIGALLGSLFVLWKGDTVGRRTSIALGASIMTVGAIIMTVTFGSGDKALGQFTAGRIITGIGNGMNTSTIPMWQSELSKAHNRGLLVLIEGALISCGIMISYWVDYGFYQIRGPTDANGFYLIDRSSRYSVQWRFPIALQCVFALILLFGILCLPESPRWLIKKGQSADAAKVLAQLDSTTVDDPQIVTTVRQLEESIAASEQLMGKFSYKELLTNGPEQNLYRTIIAFTAQAFQQLSGINLITYYATTVFKSVQPEDRTARLLAAGNGTEYFLASIVPLFMIDTLGRRNLMMSTAFMMGASMAILAGLVSVIDSVPKGTAGGYGIGASFFLYFFNTMFAWGWLGMTWLYPPEITPIRIRAPASAIATSSNWLFNFLIVMITPPAFSNIGYQTYIIFAVLNMAFIPVIWCFFPETKRRGLEEMDLMFVEAHEGKWWNAKHFMTQACYLSLTKRHLTSEELDEELVKHFGEEHLDRTRTNQASGTHPAEKRDSPELITSDNSPARDGGSDDSGSRA